MTIRRLVLYQVAVKQRQCTVCACPIPTSHFLSRTILRHLLIIIVWTIIKEELRNRFFSRKRHADNQANIASSTSVYHIT